jgi:hypothetical protein
VGKYREGDINLSEKIWDKDRENLGTLMWKSRGTQLKFGQLGKGCREMW